MNGVVMGLILSTDTVQIIDGPVEVTLETAAPLEVSLGAAEITVEIDDE
jgi:hypothetical protein